MAVKVVKIRFWWEGYTPEVVLEDPIEAFVANVNIEVDAGKGWRAAKAGYNGMDMHDWLTDEGYERKDSPVMRDKRNGTNRAWEGLYEFTYAKSA